MNYSTKYPTTHNSQAESGKFLRPREAAEYLGISQSTLAKLRMRHNRDKGPAFSRPLGRFIIYRKADLDAWLDQSIVDHS